MWAIESFAAAALGGHVARCARRAQAKFLVTTLPQPPCPKCQGAVSGSCLPL